MVPIDAVRAIAIAEAVWVPVSGGPLLHALDAAIGRYDTSHVAVQMLCGVVTNRRLPVAPEGHRLCPHCLAALSVRGFAAHDVGVLFVCPLCGRASANPNDLPERYCGCCGNDVLPRTCQHRRSA